MVANSRRILIGRTDERKVELMHLYRVTRPRPPARPLLLPLRNAGDANIPQFDLYVV